MVLSDRNKNILKELISYPSIISMDLEKKYDLTRRQLGYSIQKINDWLVSNNLPAIERTRNGHFVIDQAVFSKFSSNNENTLAKTNILTEDQRVYLIMMMLVSSEEELSLNHFTLELNVSKNTILSDLKEVQRRLDEYELTIRYSRKNGYLIEGKEFQIRKLLINVTYQILQMSNGETRLKELTTINEVQLNEFNHRIERIENTLNLKFTDEKLLTMPYILILVLRRIEKGHHINAFSIEYEELSNTKEYQATEELLYDFENLPVEERLFITLHLLTTNVHSSEILNEEAIPNLIPAIDTMLRYFEKNACIYLQDRDILRDKLLQHIQPAYYRIKYQLTDTVHFQGSLSKEFKEIHHLVKRSIRPLADLIGSDIPDSESTYITMLIGGWMSRQGESIDKKIKAIVVCPQGVSVSRLMFNEISELFPEFVFLDSLSIREFLDYPLHYDVVFSPVHLETTKKLFVTKVFLGQEEKYRLRKQVMLEVHGYIPNDIDVNYLMEIIKQHATIDSEKDLIDSLENYINRDEDAAVVKKNVDKQELNLDQLITPQNITLEDSVSYWEDAIQKGAHPLIESGSIEEEYVNRMIQYSEQDSYIVIGPNIAIPHAAPEDGVNEVGMSLLRVKEGVRYSNEFSIKLIVVIAAVDKQQHIHALMQLMRLASSEKDRNRMINANSVEEIYEIIKLYSAD
ncbi:BglG family transcription antiterminator [Oceanobacillus massiliensis]|uniref:BglG family transcription antiterminator n=1 Tax=Oceanobacillus massiliensis TaxID=1465765 RepID=UPI0002882042|nr:BglG family transcription antiterminator [Oceanobacillus massiliensis]